MKPRSYLDAIIDRRSTTIAIVIFLLVIGCMAFAFSGCSDSGSTTNAVIAGALATDDAGTVAMASVTEGEVDIANAAVYINEIPLTYGFPLEFRTEGGFDVRMTLPVYYAELNQFTAGDKVELRAIAGNGAYIYYSGDVVIPDKPVLIQPVEGQEIPPEENVFMQWSAAVNAEGYVAGYMDAGDTDETSSDDDDTGVYAEYVAIPQTEMTVPSSYTVVGDAIFSVSAVSGDMEAFTLDEDTNRSYFVTANSDWVEAAIEGTDSEAAGENKDQQAPEGSQALQIVKSYNKRIKGYTFKVRETNPYQITTSGEVHVKVTMRRLKVSIAFISAIDSNGNAYHEWYKERIYKSHKKSYKQIWSVSPGTTIVIGTHDAKFRSANYYY